MSFVGDAELHLVERVEHVELGDRQFGEPVEPGRMTQHRDVEPAGAAAAAGDGAELAPDVDESFPGLSVVLGGERAGADARAVRLGDADDTGDPLRTDARPGARPAGHRIRGRDVRIGAVVEVEERGLGALEEHMLAGLQRFVHERDRVAQVGRHAVGDLAGVARHQVVDVDRFLPEGDDHRVFSGGPRLQRGGELGAVDDVARPQADSAGLVGVGGADALQRRADAGVAAGRFGRRVVGDVPRQDEVGVGGQLQP